MYPVIYICYKYSLFLSGMKENEGHTFREFSHCSKYSMIRHVSTEAIFNFKCLCLKITPLVYENITVFL